MAIVRTYLIDLGSEDGHPTATYAIEHTDGSVTRKVVRLPELEDGRPAINGQVARLWQDGMTLRDYFAAQGLGWLLNQVTGENMNELAKSAYQLADAMLKARAASISEER